MNTKARLIAYYLPQFHPIPQNDQNWGKGFTEWTNVAKAKPFYKGHYQPHLPTELGFYDLRIPEVRQQQADLAREYGIEGFCYWHYWFGNGERLLERPFNEVVDSGKPDLPFCLCWANHSWSAIWSGNEKKIIMEQRYPGVEDYTNHFYSLLPAFKDSRYIKVNGKNLFSIFAPRAIPNCREFTSTWRKLCQKENIPDFHFVGLCLNERELESFGVDACTPITPHPQISRVSINLRDKIFYRIFGKNYRDFKANFLRTPKIYDYKEFVDVSLTERYSEHEYPVALPNWDNSPRSGTRAYVLQNSSPQLFGTLIEHCIKQVEQRPYQERIIFLKAWNEWAEGNYLEPEKKFGRGYLEELRRVNQKIV